MAKVKKKPTPHPPTPEEKPWPEWHISEEQERQLFAEAKKHAAAVAHIDAAIYAQTFGRAAAAREAPPLKEHRWGLKRLMQQAIIDRRYPGGVPDDITTADVLRQIQEDWATECAAHNVDLPPPKNWHTVHYLLSRGNTYKPRRR